MKYQLIFCIFFSFSLLRASCESIPCEKSLESLQQLTRKKAVKVLLKEDSSPAAQWSLGSEHGCIIYVPKLHITVDCDETSLLITHEEGSFKINDYIFYEPILFIFSTKGRLRSDSIPYDGFLCVSKVNETIYLVNHVELETYLAGVLPYESVPTWPGEVQKALCIACRTYAIAKMQSRSEQRENSEWSYPFDVYCTQRDQVYRGHATDVDLSEFVDTTGGLILAQDSKPILAMYSAICGGVIPADTKRFNLSEAPYLKRRYACNYCEDSKYYRWCYTYTFKELEPILKKHIPTLEKISDITLEEYDDAGLGYQVMIKDMSGTCYPMKSTKFRMLFNQIRSICCTFTTEDEKLTVQGKGYGHHVGMCQWGAYSMDKKGSSYRDILEFYYPDTTVMKYDQL